MTPQTSMLVLHTCTWFCNVWMLPLRNFLYPGRASVGRMLAHFKCDAHNMELQSMVMQETITVCPYGLVISGMDSTVRVVHESEG